CKALLGGTSVHLSGNYWLQAADGSLYLAFCDMNTDGGGWTAVFSGFNGSTNVFDHFDVGLYAGSCSDPANKCLRRAPATLDPLLTEIAVSCGGGAGEIPNNNILYPWVTRGLQKGRGRPAGTASA